MTIAQQTPSQNEIQKRTAPPRNGRWSGFRHLLGARMLELVREKEVVFWVFVFPLLLALGLGFAFRNKPADRTQDPPMNLIFRLTRNDASAPVEPKEG
jgi:hypothetical protein